MAESKTLQDGQVVTYASEEIARVMDYAHEVYPAMEAVCHGKRDLIPVAELCAVALGALREIYACPNCPGHYRQEIPPENGVERIYCAHCGGVWHYNPEGASTKPRKRSQG